MRSASAAGSPLGAVQRLGSAVPPAVRRYASASSCSSAPFSDGRRAAFMFVSAWFAIALNNASCARRLASLTKSASLTMRGQGRRPALMSEDGRRPVRPASARVPLHPIEAPATLSSWIRRRDRQRADARAEPWSGTCPDPSRAARSKCSPPSSRGHRRTTATRSDCHSTTCRCLDLDRPRRISLALLHQAYDAHGKQGRAQRTRPVV
jgi:hypothetical protein